MGSQWCRMSLTECENSLITVLPQCHSGIGGEKCDECAVGFVQEGELTPENPVLDRKIEHDELPACIECGECFTNWNRILTELKNATERKVTNCTLEIWPR